MELANLREGGSFLSEKSDGQRKRKWKRRKRDEGPPDRRLGATRTHVPVSSFDNMIGGLNVEASVAGKSKKIRGNKGSNINIYSVQKRQLIDRIKVYTQDSLSKCRFSSFVFPLLNHVYFSEKP